MSETTLVLMSGGLDSSVLVHLLSTKNKKIRGLYFDYGINTSIRELQAAKKIAFDLSIPLEIVDISGIAKMLIGYAPLEVIMADELDIEDPDPPWWPRARVSGFPVLLSIATYYAQMIGIRDIQVGVVSEQKAVHPQLDKFFTSWPSTNQLLNQDCEKFSISVPFLNMTKTDVVQLGNNLNISLKNTWSCFKGETIHCGECPSCVARKRAFSGSNIRDETEYQK